MKIFSLFIKQKSYEVVYESLEDFSCRTEWQNVLDDYFTITIIENDYEKQKKGIS